MDQTITTEQKTGIFASISIIAAIASLGATFSGHPMWGLIAALVSFPTGLIGLLMSASPKIGGGLMSLIAMLLGIFGLGLAVLGMLGMIFF